MFIFTCKEDMVKFKFHNFRQVIRACKNHMEAFLEENKNFRSDHYIFTAALYVLTVKQYTEYNCQIRVWEPTFEVGLGLQ